MRTDLTVNTPIHDVVEDVSPNKYFPRVIVPVRERDPAREPVRMFGHPSRFLGRERWIAFRCAWIADAVAVEGLFQPFSPANLDHTDGRAMLVRKFLERGIAFADEKIVGLFGGVLVDPDAAATHLMHHRQQINFQPIGVARSFSRDDRSERLVGFERAHRIGLGIRADIAGWQTPDVFSGIDLLLPLREAQSRDPLEQQGLVLAARQTVALANCFE